MSFKLWKIFASLGIPGVAIGVFYALFRAFSWDLTGVPPLVLAGLTLAVLIVISIIITMTLRLWRPRSSSSSSVEIGSGSHVIGDIAGRDLAASREVGHVKQEDVHSSVKLGKGTTVGGSIAGRDLVVNHDRLPDRTEELALLLEDRAKVIRRNLANHFKYTPVKEFLARFEPLHRDHIAALRQGHLARAHEILVEIHRISYELARNEFWTRHHHETPETRYMLSGDAFQRGDLIDMYVGGDAMEALVSEAMNRIYQDRDMVVEPVNAATLYNLVLDSKGNRLVNVRPS